MQTYQLHHPLSGVPTLFLDRESGAPLLEIPQDGPASECWQLPTQAEPLLTRYEATAEILDAITALELPEAKHTAALKVLEQALSTSTHGPPLLASSEWSDLQARR